MKIHFKEGKNGKEFSIEIKPQFIVALGTLISTIITTLYLL